MKNVIIIGSGFGGLSLAIRLQARGHQVTLLEKNSMVGGHASQLKKDGYTFDLGPSLITAPDLIDRVFQAAGRSMSDYLKLIPLDPFYRIYYHDGSFLDYTSDPERMKAQMSSFDANDGENYDRFMAYTRRLYDAVITDGLGAEPFDFSRLIQFLPQALRLQALRPAYSVVSRFFNDPRNRFAFSFHPLFIGGNPFRAPAVYLMIPYLEKTGGVWFTKGGMYSLVKAFETVFAELGGTIRTDAEVSEILVRDGRAVGVRLKDERLHADLVVSNAHFAHTHLQLLQTSSRRKWSDRRVKHLKYSMSSVLLYLGVRKQYPQLRHHTLILSDRYRGLVRDIFDRKILPDDFSLYLHVPTRTDPDMAPPGCESMYVLIPVPNLAGSTDWNEAARPYADRILEFLEKDFGLEDLRSNIEVMEIFTPQDFSRRRNNYLGSAWGIEPTLTQSASFRPGNKSEDIKDLYLVGASTHPGAGVPGVLLGAEATAAAIESDYPSAVHRRPMKFETDSRGVS